MTCDKNPEKIKSMFEEIAIYYDKVNNLISFGTHYLIKYFCIKELDIKPRAMVLDLCCGTGDFSKIINKIYPRAKVIGIDFSNEIKILSNLIEEDMIESKSFVPYEFTNNKVVYGKNGYEWVEGIGIYDVKNKTNNFVEQIDSEYLRHSEDNIFYTEQYEPKTIQKVNVLNANKEQFFVLDEGQSEYPNRRVYLSEDLEKILVTENIYNEDMVEISLKLYDANTKQLIYEYNLEPERYANIDDVIFEEDKVIFSKSYNLYIWNYVVK